MMNQVLYTQFDPTRGWTWGNGTLTVREYNTDGQLTTIDSAGLSTYTYNSDGTIGTIAHDSSANLGLSIGQTNLSVSTTSNRINSTAGTLVRTYSYDAAGNMTGDGQRAFIYNDAGRMTSTTHVGITTSYLYNALGQRVQKSNANGTTNFVYDESGHLLGEYDQAGNLIQEIVWLGDIPVATIRTDQSGGSVGVFYVHTDHLNAPTKVTRPTDNAIIWHWDHDPFGNGTPNQDPDGNGLQLTMNLRFPGQYYDQETGLYYNMERYYDPVAGRYITSDPIGLIGGINTYAYALGNPLSFIDPLGLYVPQNNANCTVTLLPPVTRRVNEVKRSVGDIQTTTYMIPFILYLRRQTDVPGWILLKHHTGKYDLYGMYEKDQNYIYTCKWNDDPCGKPRLDVSTGNDHSEWEQFEKHGMYDWWDSPLWRPTPGTPNNLPPPYPF